ncbi:hypothetical protein M9434_007200 [Picochlorum sp. BPE23]|nr:hypothetical protein M9434_007200 [Picochlorum sp. BPE23]
MYVVAVIPARKGSKRLPGKNSRLTLGKPLFWWSIESAKAAAVFDEIIVSTDSEDIRHLAISFGASSPELRPEHLASDSAQCIDAVQHAVQNWTKRVPDIVVILQPTSPLREANEISAVVNKLVELGRGVDAVVTVTEPRDHPDKCYVIDGDLLKRHREVTSTNRQDLDHMYKDTGSIYCFWWSSHRADNRLLCGLRVDKIHPFVASNSTSVDIDSLDDWKKCQFELLKRCPPKPFMIGSRPVGEDHPPLVIAEIGINHEGCMAKAVQMVDDAISAGAHIVKFQCHICEDEMIPAAKGVIPGNAPDSIWNIMKRCELTKEEVIELKRYVESKGAIYMSSPFSRDAANFLEEIGVQAYKIGSGECNNYPLVEHIARFGKPVILSTGMNSMETIEPSVNIFRNFDVPFAVLHCTSLYPTPYSQVRLGCISQIKDAFPDAIIGLSDHSMGNWTCFGAVSLGACILEKHFTSDKSWDGPDIPISIDPNELSDLVQGCRNIWQARGGQKTLLNEEQVTCDFAFASVVTIARVMKGERFTLKNIWVKRPGTGDLPAKYLNAVLGCEAAVTIDEGCFVMRSQVKDLEIVD